MAKKRLSRRRKSKSLNGLFLIIIGVVILAALIGTSVYISTSKVVRNKETMCREDGFISRETALVFDATDNFTPTQKLMIERNIQNILENALEDERFILYVMGADIKKSRERQFVLCNPNDGKDKSALTANVKRLKQQWDELFFNRIMGSVSGTLESNHTANFSPILEMIKYVAIDAMYNSDAKQKRMIIVSDMLQHMPAYSHYRGAANYERFTALPYAQEQAPHLSGVDVTILYLSQPRYQKLQSASHISFWEKHITQNGGNLSRILRVN